MKLQKQVYKIGVLFMMVSLMVLQGCSSAKKNSCKCPSKKGMVGYL